MADEFSFDVGCKVDMQEVTNAINQALKEISQRFDFKGSKSTIELDKGKQVMTIASDDEFKLNSVKDILESKLVKRNVVLKTISYGKVEQAAGGSVRQIANFQQGIPIEKAKEVVKLVKDMKLKVNAEIQGDTVRIKSKKKDELQAVIAAIKERDFGIFIEVGNYR
ncbi:YajQ family cyclic di-GMP-binding protein [Candidatus Magnetomonas plexicatena]|uniref:YajQ family cyclic di-GMP-binding protein n=1 Tax=Candidatus Magnetomonas plexicatena TaxID=2552947 RepID=UPI001C7571C7|nr:YajQ family cyclic di-GMP-binding protein [Nitrospirales bacterium LBB_01]